MRGLASLGAGTSSGKVMTKLGACCFKQLCVNSSPLDKMAAILADDNFKCIFLNGNDRILIQILLKSVSRGSNWQ